MKNTFKKIIITNILLLIPLIIYGIYKNGYLIYQKDLISIITIFKPLLLVLISLFIKLLYDLIKYKKILIDYNLLYVILIPMITPYNISYILYTIIFSIAYILSNTKYIKINKVIFIYLIIILFNSIFNSFTYTNLLEQLYTYKFSFLDHLFGRNIGGISSTSIILSLISFIILLPSIYYKKEITISINISYLLLSNIYFIIFNNSSYLLNSEVIFASIFICNLNEYTPFKRNNCFLYGIVIGIITFIISILFNSVIAIYISTLLIDIILLIIRKIKE